MDPLKKCDTRNLSPARRKKSQHSFRSMGQTDRANSPGISREETSSTRLTFAEDFMMEHCNSSQSMALSRITASLSYASAPKESGPSAQAFGFPS